MNDQRLSGARSKSAVAVRVAAAVAVVALLLLVIGGTTNTWGLAVVGGITLGAAVITGIIGAAFAR